MITVVNITRKEDASMISQMTISADIVIVYKKEDGTYLLKVVGRESELATLYYNNTEVTIIQSRK